MPKVEAVTSTPKVVINPQQVAPKNLILGLLIGTTLIGSAIVAFYFFQLKNVTPSLPVKLPKVDLSLPKKATPSAKKGETKNWKTYSNSELGFSIKYPDKWFYNDATKYTSENCEAGASIDEKTVLFDRKNLRCKGVGHFGLWPAEFVVYVSPTEWDPLENITAEKYTSITIDEEKGVKNFRSATSEGPRCTCTRIYLNHNSKGYYIEFSNKDLKGKYDPIYDSILSTFQFLD
jgi:hypothetical protein